MKLLRVGSKGKEKPGKLDELKTHIRATVYDPARSKYLTFQEFEKRAVLSRFPGMKGIANVHGEEIPEIIKPLTKKVII